VVALADAVGSTSAILKAAREMDAKEFIVATDNGMMHKLRTLNPGKLFLEAPTAGNSATCKSCAHCPWMAMNGLADVVRVLETGANEVHVDPTLIPVPANRLTVCWPLPQRSKVGRMQAAWCRGLVRPEPQNQA